MMQEKDAAAGAQDIERRFEGPLRLWEALFLLAFAGAILVAACVRSEKTYFNNDELTSVILVANPNFAEMCQAIRRGGDLNPPLFHVLEWLVARTAGTSELALRAIPAFSVALAGVLLFLAARPLTGPRVAALAVAIVFGLSRDVLVHCANVRYYGLLLLLVAWAVFLALRPQPPGPVRKRDCVLFFLSHCALVYLHLYGLFYSGVILAAMIAADWLKAKRRWGVYASVAAAWVTFGAWVPVMRHQLKMVSGGVYTPPGMLDLGIFLEQLSLETALPPVLLLVTLLGLLALASSRPGRMAEEANACSAPLGWAAGGLVALAIMGVPVGTWIASHFMKPPPYIPRYCFPCLSAWVLIIALILFAAHRLPRPGAAPRPSLPPRLGAWVWLGALAVGLLFQPVRAFKSPARPPAPFVDDDYGYKDLPIVFENAWYYQQRAWYGRGRQYALLIDHDAAEADPGWYTKYVQRIWNAFHPYYPGMKILYFSELPDGPKGFLAVQDDYTSTFKWLFAHHPELEVKLLGTRQCDPAIFGQQRVYWVRKKHVAMAGGSR